jgi:hypothetical protein
VERQDLEGLNAEEEAIIRNERVNVYGQSVGLTGLFSPNNRDTAGGTTNLYHHATHSASNSLQATTGAGIRGIDLGLSLGVNVGTFSY